MQANCTNCQQRIVIDDAKVPDRAFSVKCPKCQTVVRFPGKGAAPVVSAPGTSSFASNLPAGAYPAAPPTSAYPAYPERARGRRGRAGLGARAPAAADGGRSALGRAAGDDDGADPAEMSIGEGKMAGRAMVALSDRGQAGAMALPLTRLGYQVDTVDNAEEGARLLEQGMYDLVVAVRTAAAGGRESLYQRLNRLSPDRRRRIFLVIVGDEFKTGEGTQAWGGDGRRSSSPRATSRTRTRCCSPPWPSARASTRSSWTPASATRPPPSSRAATTGGWLAAVRLARGSRPGALLRTRSRGPSSTGSSSSSFQAVFVSPLMNQSDPLSATNIP